MRIDRRKLLVALAALTLGVSLVACNRQAAANQNPDQWRVKIVSDQEPGEPLIVSGTIYSPDGKQPLPGITLYVYQTDATGRDSTSGGDNRGTRTTGDENEC
jgi:protocatechuate 3,4-dioxygenase beta subunit